MHSRFHLRSQSLCSGRRHGFALLVSLVLMGFLLMLILSLSALTRVELQTSDVVSTQAQARNNALLGLQVAMGQLQQFLGPDKAVSATAALLDSDLATSSGPDSIEDVVHPAWVGVWTPDKVPAQATSRSGRVGNIAGAAQTWLVSGAMGKTALSPLDGLSGETVKLAAAQSALYDTAVKHPAVEVPKVDLDGGSYAYWISDEGVKANLSAPQVRAGSSSALLPQLSQRTLGLTMVGAGALDGGSFESFVSERESDEYGKVHSLRQAEYIPSSLRGGGFDTVAANAVHDLTVDSVGLLTDARSGGLRRDLSTMLAAGATAPSGRIFPPQSGDNANGGPLWTQLQDFLNLTASGSDYINGSGELVPFTPTGGIKADDLVIAPVIVRMQYFHTGMIVKRGPDDYVLRLYYMPAVVLWNPYSLPIEAHSYSVNVGPVTTNTDWKKWVKYELRDGGGAELIKDEVNFSDAAGSSLKLKSTASNDLVAFEPGEIKVFSMGSSTDNKSDFYLVEGFYGWEGFFQDVKLSAVTDATDLDAVRLLLRPNWYYAYDARLNNANNDTLRYAQTMQRIMPVNASPRAAFAPAYDQTELAGVSVRDGYPAAVGTFVELTMPNSQGGYATTTAQARRRPWLSHYNPVGHRFAADSNIPSGSASNTLKNHSPLYAGRGEVDIDATSRNYHLNGYQIEGSDKLVLIQIPDAELPPYSLGQLQHAQLRSPSNTGGRNDTNTFGPLYAIGNSLANPQIKLDEVYSKAGSINVFTYYDTSWLLNDALWDAYFLSSADYSAGAPAPSTHPRLHRLGSGAMLTPPDAALKASANYGIHGAFNVNSTSVQAWKALLGSFIGVDVQTAAGTDAGADRSAMLRLNKPLRGEHAFDGAETGDSAAQGFRGLSDEQVESLAVEIVRQVKERGPFLDLASFVNRSTLSSASDSHKRSGLIQAALDVNNHDSKNLNQGFGTRLSLNGIEYKDNPSMNIPLGWGMPGFLTQGDVLSRIGHLLAARSDTFKIRVFGESKDTRGNSIATAYGEAVVQRLPEYVNPAANNSWDVPASSSENGKFGRRFTIVSFRWLSEDEI